MKIFLSCLIMVLLLSSWKISSNEAYSNEYDIEEFYEGLIPDNGVKVIAKNGNIDEADIILVPTKIELGNYQVTITRKASNIYKIDSTSYYFETRYCYEYGIGEEVIIKVESSYGYSKGTVIFD